MNDLVVITGATGGIGRCVARQLATRCVIPVIGHRAEKTAEANELAESCGGIPIVLDMSDPLAIDQGISRLIADGRAVVGVVLAASPLPELASFGKIAPEAHARFWTANVVGPHHLLSGVLRHWFRPRKAGSVVAVLTRAMDGGKSGQEVPRAMSNMGAYTISKFGLLGVLAQLNGEYPWLRISAVKPGFTDTSMLRIFDDRFLNQMREQKEFSTPEEVAAEIVERLALNDTGL